MPPPLLGALPPPDMHRSVTLASYHPTQARCRRLMLRQRVEPIAGDSRSASPSFLRRKLSRHAGGSTPQDRDRGAEKEEEERAREREREREREGEREAGLQRPPSSLEPSPPPPLAAEESVRALPLASYHPTHESASALVEP